MYFSFGETDVCHDSVRELLASTVLQLLIQEPARYIRIEGIIKAMTASQSAWTQAAMLSVFHSILDTTEGQNPLYLVIDHLDRCDSSWSAFLNVLLAVFRDSRQQTEIKVALFCQERQDIHTALDGFGELRMHGPVLTKESAVIPLSVNLADYVVSNNPRLFPFKDQISATLDKCREVSVLPLTLHSVQNITTSHSSLGSVSALIEALPAPIQKEISSRFNRLSAWGRTAVGWLCHAKRALSLGELVTAVALTKSEGEFIASFDPGNLILVPAAEVECEFNGLVRCWNGCLVFRTEGIKESILELIVQDPQLRLSRCTGQADPESSHTATLSDSKDIVIPDDEKITDILVQYLSWGQVHDQVKLALAEVPYIRPPGPHFDLVPYAMQFWSHHYRKAAAGHTQVSNMLIPRLERIASLYSTDPFLLAAQVGLTDIVKNLKDSADVPETCYAKAIMFAVRDGYEDTVDYLWDLQSSSIEDTGAINEILQQISEHGYENAVKKILDHVKSANMLDGVHLDSLLCQAAQLGYGSQVKLFLEYGADVNGTANGATPLQRAAGNGHASIVCYLLNQDGVDVDSQSGTQTDAPILLAAAKGYELVVEHLLRLHANTMARTRSPGQIAEGTTPLHLAASHGYLGIVTRLLPSPTLESSVNMPNIDERDSTGRSPLMIACSEGHQDITEHLLNHGARVDTGLDTSGHSTIYYAVRPEIGESLVNAMFDQLGQVEGVSDIGDVFFEAVKHGFAGIVKRCLSLEPPIKVDDNVGLVNRRDKDQGRTALHHAADLGHADIALLLLDALRDANQNERVDARDDSKDTPLALAAMAGRTSTVELLLTRGADAFLIMSDGRTVVNAVASSNSSCTEGHVEVLKSLLRRGVDPNTADEFGLAPIHWAAGNGHADITRFLLGLDEVDASATGSWSWNAVHFAADSEKGSARRVAELLIHAGVDPLLAEVDGWIPIHLASRADNTDTALLQLLWEQDQKSIETRAKDGRTALHFGSRQYKTLQWLIEHGADVNAKDNDGETALVAAVTDNTGVSIRVLLDNGADPMLVDGNGMTALHRAARRGYGRAVKALLTFGKDVETFLSNKDPDNCSALHVAIWNAEPLVAEMLLDCYETATDATHEDLSAKRKKNGDTPLISAVRLNQQGVIKRLLALGADTEIRNNKGDTALLEAVANSGKDKAAVLRLLLKPRPGSTPRADVKRADVNAGGGPHPTALHEAARTGELDLVKQLVLEHDADVNALGGQYQTALVAAACQGHTGVAEFLLEHEAVSELPGDDLPYTFHPLQAAVYSASIELVSKLLEVGSNLLSRDIQGRTALHIAAGQGSWEMMKELVMNRPDVDIADKDKQGRTLLHHAALGHDRELIDKVLLVWDIELEGALSIPDTNGWTPLHWACRIDDNEEIVESLLNAGEDSDILLSTADGWTPESICAFHDSGTTKAFVDERAQRIRATSGVENPEPDIKELEPERQYDAEHEDTSASRPAEKDEHKRWKVGHFHPTVSCDGCMIQVSA